MIRRISRVSVLKKKESSEKEEEETQSAKEEEFPFQDVLADKRRKYNSTEKYVQLMYNDLVNFFVKKREGTFLRKSIIPSESLDSLHPEDEEGDENKLSEDDVEAPIDKKRSTIDSKLYKPDEMVEIVFVNGNSYIGRISKQKMEGQGAYRWHHGSQYKGEFEDNKIQGRGTLEWQDCARYEGDFENGYLHGKGTMLDKNYNLLYIGEWQKGQKHGKGLCRFEKNDTYDGDWLTDKRDGIGNRTYPSGARYFGNWKNGFRHQTGTMVWPNGDCYQGEWDKGLMHCYGEYTWNRVFSKNLCWPREICYKGQWDRGMCDGKGQLTLNSIGEAKYSGEWKKNKKHGCGTIIGNNGDVTEGDPLFGNNILLPAPTIRIHPESENENDTLENDRFVTNPTKIRQARITSVLKPIQCPSLQYYVDRLRQPEIISSSRISLVSAKCRKCENISCTCLDQYHNGRPENGNIQSRPLPSKSMLKEMPNSVTSTVDLDQREGNPPTATTDNPESIKIEKEEHWAYKCIAMHMPRIRKIYDEYSKIFCNTSSNCKLTMSRLSLWQLWRDCGIPKKNLGLVQIDKYLAANKSTSMEDPHCPYERIAIWQLIHAFLEVSWHLYTKKGDIDQEGYPGRLANGLHKFLVNDIYPNFGNSIGVLCGPERNLLSIYPVYQLYKSIGKPHTAKQFLKAVFPMPGITDEDKNSTPLGNKCSDLSNSEAVRYPTEKSGNLTTHSLHAFQDLGATEFIQIISITCPSLKDPETKIIVNIEYELTFLEFLEIFVDAGKRLVRKRNMQRESDRKKSEVASMASTTSGLKGRRSNSSTSRLSVGSKLSKSRKKLMKKH